MCSRWSERSTRAAMRNSRACSIGSAAGIEALSELGEGRAVYLDQVRFIAQQAVEPEEKRQASVVRAVFESLRGRLQDTANLAQVLALAGPAIARHFGIHWPF